MSYLPTSVTGCQLWLDASDSSSLVLSGSNVTTWNDKSGSNYHMNTLTATADWSGTATYPTIGTPINGLQTVNFLAQSGLRQSTTLDGVKNLFWVGRIAAPNGTGGIHTSYFILGHETFYDWHGLAYGQKFLDPAIATAGIQNASPTSLFTSDVNAITNTAFANVFKPSAPNVSILSVAGITGSTRYQGLCFDRTYHFGWCGDLAEVIIYSTALSTEQRQTTETYLAQKWGLTSSLPAGHPGFVYIPPRQKLLSIPKTIISTTTYLPTSIAGCQLWLDGNDPLGTGSAPPNGETVSTWVDKSVNGYNATAAPSRVAGTYSTSFRAVNFPNSNTGYITSYSASPTNETMFVVFNNPSPSYSNNILIGGLSGARSLGAGYSGNGGQNANVVGNLNTQLAWLATTAVGSYTAGNTVIVRSEFTTSSNSISLNGGTYTSSGGAPGFTANRVTYLGVDAVVSSFYYIGYAMEIIFYNSILTTTQRQEVEGYLAQKWSLTASLVAGHPGRTTVYTGTISTLAPTTFVSTYSPTSITGCALWLDGLDPLGTGTPPSSGATVSTWSDKSGNGKNAAATGTPTYVSGGGINFNGSSYFLNQTFSQNLSQRSIFIVFNQTTNTDYAGVFPLIPSSGSDNETSTGLSCEMQGIKTISFVGNAYAAGVGYRSTLTNSSALAIAIYNDNMNTRTGSGYVNGSNSTNVTADYTAGTCSGYGVGGRWISGSMYGSNRFIGVIYEILFFNTPLTTTQRQQVESYLAQKWSLTASLVAGHPGITTSVYQVTLPLPKQKFTSLPRALTVITYSPASIAGCQLWLDGEDSSFMTVAAGKVSQWRDKSGSNNHATSPSSIRDPTLTANAQNSKSVITFSGSQNFTGPITLGTIFTQFIVYFNSSGRIGQGLMDSNDASLLGKLAYQEGGSECFQSGFGFSYQRFFKTGGAYRILMTKCSNPSSSATVSHWFNGTDQNISSGIWTIYGGNSTAISSYTIAARGDLIYFIGTIAEIIIYNSVISLDQQREVEAYLGQKWGISSSLPAGHIGRTTFSYQTTVIPPKQKIRAIPPLISYTRTFSYTGSNQTFVVPATTTSITVYMWGAGGAGNTNYGGAGAMVQGVFTTTPGETLNILVGQGGTINGSTTYGGGGAGAGNMTSSGAGIGYSGNGSPNNGGSGGGRSAIQRGGTDPTNDIVVAGGGGGGTFFSSDYGGSATFSGTANPGAGGLPGLGGTQSAGGGGGGTGQYGQGLGGSRGIGGNTYNHNVYNGGGGGGGGYYGGGAGGTNLGDGAGGGGGSSLTGGLSLISGQSVLGFNSTNGFTAPNTGSPYYQSGIGNGAPAINSSPRAGGNGLVVLVYIA